MSVTHLHMSDHDRIVCIGSSVCKRCKDYCTFEIPNNNAKVRFGRALKCIKCRDAHAVIDKCCPDLDKLRATWPQSAQKFIDIEERRRANPSRRGRRPTKRNTGKKGRKGAKQQSESEPLDDLVEMSSEEESASSSGASSHEGLLWNAAASSDENQDEASDSSTASNSRSSASPFDQRQPLNGPRVTTTGLNLQRNQQTASIDEEFQGKVKGFLEDIKASAASNNAPMTINGTRRLKRYLMLNNVL